VDVKGNWWILRNEHIYDLYCSPNVSVVLEYGEEGVLRLASNVACTIGEEKLVLGSVAVNVKERDRLEDLSLDGRQY
jgi:hypothetical protein